MRVRGYTIRQKYPWTTGVFEWGTRICVLKIKVIDRDLFLGLFVNIS